VPNHLAGQKSPYLLQHADNPVDWYPWGPEALAKAEREDKPIFLSVGYATCHWCHVMAHECFEDAEVAGLLNEHFVAIKVDREERPDIDDVYMTVCQALTGQGGWPLSVFLTPERRPFFAGTYFPKHPAMGRPGFLQVLSELARRWQSPERARMIQAAEEITRAITPRPQPGRLDEPTLRAAVSQLAQSFDQRYGGFGEAPKFPTPHQYYFLLRRYHHTGEAGLLAMVEKSLGAMRDGGIFDQVGYGFHRYSVDPKWLVPHFEKMLYDQALLTMAYLEAFQATGKARYARTAGQVLEYVLRDMRDPAGGFYSAEDADSQGGEGRFYVWTPAQVAEVLGPAPAKLFNEFYGITGAGNFEHGLSIPHRTGSLEDLARRQGRAQDEVAAELEQSRVRLLAARERRPRPLKDDKVLTAWNGLMIAALAMAHRVLGDPAYLEAAGRAAGFVLGRLTDDQGRLMRRWREGRVQGEGFLEDYAFMIWGLVELHQAGQDPAHLQSALELTEMVSELFGDPAAGGFFFTPVHGESLIIRAKDAHDGALPSSNSAMAYNLLRLARLTGRAELEEAAGRVLEAQGALVQRHPPGFALLLCALQLALAPGREIVLAGEGTDPVMAEMLAALRGRYAPDEVVLLRPGGREGELVGRLAPFSVAMDPPAQGALAYVCQGHACRRPVDSAAALAELLEAGS